MKHLILIILATLISCMTYSQDLKLMTYNIRYDSPNDGINKWDIRKEELKKQVQFYEPDIMGTQEGLKHQLDYLNEELANYEYFGVGRDDGIEKGEYCAVYYRKDKFDVMEHNTFWLSETPDKISKGWDASLERICTYALFKYKKTDQQFYVFNTHFDHRGEEARKQSAQLIITKIDEINTKNLPVVLMGDLNLESNSEPIQFLSNEMMDSKIVSVLDFGPEGTFTGFDYNSTATRRIDYIFLSEDDFEVAKYAVISDPENFKFPSDHFPVYVEMSFEE